MFIFDMATRLDDALEKMKMATYKRPLHRRYVSTMCCACTVYIVSDMKIKQGLSN